jgi:urease accessory protein
MKTFSNAHRSLLSIALLTVLPAVSQAHHAEFMSDRPFLQGLSMPVHGLDHLLVAIAVGLIAARLGGRALWWVPASFTAAMIVGGVLNVSGVALPLVEWGILASLVVLGGVLARSKGLSLVGTAGVVALFAGFHGQALALNDGLVQSLPFFSTGCLVTALGLQGTGIALGLSLQRFGAERIYRTAGCVLLMGAVLVSFFPEANDWLIRVLEGAAQ